MPVIGALIASNELGYQAFTNAKGYFNIKRMVGGDYTISVSFPGYVPVEQQVSLTAGIGSKMSLTLVNAMKKVA
ncbi:MAG: carboxypeptidase-like regulatory domain-containing protein [Bacteroidota bacterium]|nr:carboxypeptidase-like regulatory domain-containing protein [Bacteroidota bacterium]